MTAAMSGRPGVLPRYALLTAMVIGTMSNNIVNVPLRAIAEDLNAPVEQAVLAVLAFSLFLAVAMPLAGWLGDRLGRRRILAAAVALMALSQLAAALAPSLPVLGALRGVQGLGCSGIPPLVMGLLVWMYPDQQAVRWRPGRWPTGSGRRPGPRSAGSSPTYGAGVPSFS